MKKLTFLFVLMILLVSCSTRSEEDILKEKESIYFLNEKFILSNKASNDDNLWVIQRLKEEYPDTVECAELHSNASNDVGTFQISKELWYSKEVGDTLSFEYILKSRFFKIPKKSIVPKEIHAPNPYMNITPTDNNMDKMQLELEILKIERELTTLKEELKKYN